MSSPQTNQRLTHLPALDGLRGLAVLGVVLFHAEGSLRGGYLGVDLFFVLSGFLITSILLGEYQQTQKVDLKAFWVRRARRLFPALLALMPAIALYGHFFAQPDELRGIRNDALATLAYVANWRAIFSNKTYWELFTARSPLEHTWSLSIEEQFYVFWPLLFVLVLHLFRKGTKFFLALTTAMALGSAVTMLLVYTPESTTRAYYGTDTRSIAILLGAAFSLWLGPRPIIAEQRKNLVDSVGVIALIVLGAAWAKLDGQSYYLYHGGFWLTELAGLALIACAITPQSRVARVLSIRPLTFAGTISYGVYLWHWPVDCVLTSERLHLGAWPTMIVRIVVTITISLISFYLLEQPIRHKGLPFGRPVIVVPAAFLLSFVTVILGTLARPKQDPVLPTLTAKASASAADAGPPPEPFDILVLGDSTANSLGWCLRGLQEPGMTVHLYGKDGCTMYADNCDVYRWKEYTETIKPNATIIFLGGAFMHGKHVNGVWQKSCNPTLEKLFRDALQEHLSTIASESNPPWVLTIPHAGAWWDSEEHRAEITCINASIRKAAAATQGVRVLDFAEQLCPKGQCIETFEDNKIRPDGVHYDISGAYGLAQWIMTNIRPPTLLPPSSNSAHP